MFNILDENYDSNISKQELNSLLTEEYKEILYRNKISNSLLQLNNIKYIDDKYIQQSLEEVDELKNIDRSLYLNKREMYYSDRLNKYTENDDIISILHLLDEFKLEIKSNKSLTNLYFSFALIESNKVFLENFDNPKYFSRPVMMKRECMKATIYGGVAGGTGGGTGGAVKGGIGGVFMVRPVGAGVGAIGGFVLGGLGGFISGAFQGYAGYKLFG